MNSESIVIYKYDLHVLHGQVGFPGISYLRFIIYRVFSNFENLMELHLTDAFADNSPEDLASDLHDIFFNSDLNQLRKLHLEQNEITPVSYTHLDVYKIQDMMHPFI